METLTRMNRCVLSCLALVLGTSALAQEAVKPTFGHSMQGEAFNEGPRQRAVLLKGIPKIDFPTSTKNKQAQKFFEQGVAQLHAYWYFESERSFRQAAALDPEFAMAYWGMARSNVNNRPRAKGFADKAVEKRAKANPREQAYIDAIAFFANNKPDDYIKTLRKLTEDYPLDIEARAFLAHELQERAVNDKQSEEVERLTQEVLADNPFHPIHHYRIHLWDRPSSERALDSAHRNGVSMPASAHMWHMEGHTYTQLKRYNDAAESQERSSRTDHAHMARVGIIPDQIFNYAHNNQWLAESLEFVGQPQKALAIAKGLVSNPRHPKYNQLAGFGSANQGIPRLLETLERYELWEEALALSRAGYIESLPSRADQERNRLRLLGSAAYALGKRSEGQQYLSALTDLAEKQKNNAEYAKSLATVQLYAALNAKDTDEARKQLELAGLPQEREALLHLTLSQPEKALAAAQTAAKSRPNQVLPQATLVRVLSGLGKRDEAKTELEKLRSLAITAELDTPLLAAITPIAQACGLPADWRAAPSPDPLALKRVEKTSLGPLVWEPPTAPALTGRDATGRKVSLADYKGKNVLVLFFLGASCERCMQQLTAFAAQREGFEKAGISLLAVSIDPQDEVKALCAPSGAAAKYGFPILADPDLKQFRSWRAYDDFEKMALHGTFLVDGQGKIRWMDTGFAPFTQAEFVLTESQRLLKLGQP